MPPIITSEQGIFGDAEDDIGTDGKLWTYRPGSPVPFTTADLRNIPLPVGTNGVRRQPSWALYNSLRRSRLYGAGAWTSNIVIDEYLRALRQGIPAFTITPTVAAVAGPGVTNTSTCYLRPLDYLGQRIGPLSAGTDVVLANQQRSWTALPTTHPDPSVSHLQGLVGADGAEPRVTWTRELGATSVVEGVPTGQLGENAPATFTELPLCTFNVMYHDAQWLSGSQIYPERVFRSALAELEHYEGLFVQTDGEAVRGEWVSNDQLFFGSKYRIYRVTGFDEGDLAREIEKPDIGIISHYGIAHVHGRTIVPTTVGFFLYDGRWNFITDDRQEEFRNDYRTYHDIFEQQAFGRFDPVANVYKFGPVPLIRPTGEQFEWKYWVLDGERLFPETETLHPAVAWGNDARTRRDTGAAVFYLPGTSEPTFVTGSTDGMLRSENTPDVGDDGDTYNKRLTIEPAALMPDPGGDIFGGFTFHKLWVYMECPFQVHSVQVRCGGEHVRDITDPHWTNYNVPQTGGQFLETFGKQWHVIEPCVGDALQLKIEVGNAEDYGPDHETAPAGIFFRGFGLTRSVGLSVQYTNGDNPTVALARKTGRGR